MSEIHWVGSNGGPLILLPESLLSSWEGSRVPSNGRVVRARFRGNSAPNAPATDYDRACDVDDNLGSIPVGDGFGLVLDGEPVMTTWRPLDDAKEVLLVQCLTASKNTDDTDPTFLSVLDNLPDQIWGADDIRITIPKGRVYLFDSAYPSNTYEASPDDQTLVIEMAGGDYFVSTAEFKPDSETSFLLYRLSQAGN